MNRRILSIIGAVIMIMMAITSTNAETCVGTKGAFGYISHDAIQVAQKSMAFSQTSMFATISELYSMGYIVPFGGYKVVMISKSETFAVIMLESGLRLITNPAFVECGK